VAPLSLQLVVNALWDRYSSAYTVPTRILKAVEAICMCRTGAFGVFKAVCPDGHVEKYFMKSCWHRFCGQCGFGGKERFVEHWRGKLLDCAYHHIIFTLPGRLRVLWLYNRRSMADVLFKASSDTLKTLMLEEKWCGGVPGILSALHTWGQSLQLHPHVHCLVTAGGLAGEEFVRAKKRFLFPFPLVQWAFRKTFLNLLEERFEEGRIKLPPDMDDEAFYELTGRLRKVKWKVQVMERYETYGGVLEYLARYMRGGPIAGSRLIAFDEKQRVTFRYQDNRVKDLHVPPTKLMTLGGMVFMKLYLEHVPPKGYQTIRGYGLYANTEASRRLLVARAALKQGPVEKPAEASLHNFLKKRGLGDAACCPVCNKPLEYRYNDDRFSKGALLRARLAMAVPKLAQAPP
jgi:hypothetical protein